MTNKKLISVVIPAYNHERFIAQTIESVLSQSYSDLELVIIDDGSQDRTGEICQSYDDKRIKYVYQENQDAFNALNNGIALAQGEFISILNSDDVYTPNRLQRLMDEHLANGAECLISDVIPISDDGEELADPALGWNIWHQKNRDFYKECGDIYTAFLKGNYMVTTSNLFATASAFQKVGKFCSLRYLHDYDFIFRMMLAFPGKVAYLADEKLLYYRIHSGNTLKEAAVTGRLQDMEVIRRYMLEKIDKEQRQYVEAGSDRLVELVRELHDVESDNAAVEKVVGVKASGRAFLKALVTKFTK